MEVHQHTNKRNVSVHDVRETAVKNYLLTCTAWHAVGKHPFWLVVSFRSDGFGY